MSSSRSNMHLTGLFNLDTQERSKQKSLVFLFVCFLETYRFLNQEWGCFATGFYQRRADILVSCHSHHSGHKCGAALLSAKSATHPLDTDHHPVGRDAQCLRYQGLRRTHGVISSLNWGYCFWCPAFKLPVSLLPDFWRLTGWRQRAPSLDPHL